MTLRSPIVNLRPLKKGQKVGYDGRAIAKEDMLIATVYLGYADGLPVNIQDETEVMINNQTAKVFGRVSMDLTTIDVTNIIVPLAIGAIFSHQHNQYLILLNQIT